MINYFVVIYYSLSKLFGFYIVVTLRQRNFLQQDVMDSFLEGKLDLCKISVFEKLKTGNRISEKVTNRWMHVLDDTIS